MEKVVNSFFKRAVYFLFSFFCLYITMWWWNNEENTFSYDFSMAAAEALFFQVLCNHVKHLWEQNKTKMSIHWCAAIDTRISVSDNIGILSWITWIVNKKINLHIIWIKVWIILIKARQSVVWSFPREHLSAPER